VFLNLINGGLPQAQKKFMPAADYISKVRLASASTNRINKASKTA
jgi:hypothetical protein